MKKILSLVFIAASVVVLSGCGKEPEAPAYEIPKPELMGSGKSMEVLEAPTPVIDTEVAPIENYESSDDLLQDIDSMVDDLDNI